MTMKVVNGFVFVSSFLEATVCVYRDPIDSGDEIKHLFNVPVPWIVHAIDIVYYAESESYYLLVISKPDDGFLSMK